MPDQPLKPTGEIGAVQFGPTMPEPVFTPVPFPATKAEIERLVAEYFLADVRAKGAFTFDLGSPEQNAEDDLDFTINTNHGRMYLELTEVHLRGLSEELPTGQYANESYAVAERVWKQIHAKSEKVSGRHSPTNHSASVRNTLAVLLVGARVPAVSFSYGAVAASILYCFLHELSRGGRRQSSSAVPSKIRLLELRA